MQTYQDSGGYGGGLALPSITPVVKQLLILNFGIWVGLFLVSLVADGLLQTQSVDADGRLVLSGLIPYLGATPYLWFDGFPWVLPWQPLTYGFLHSPSDPWHLLLNSLFLYFFGTRLEGTLGSRRFMGFYLAAIVAAGVSSLLLKPWLTGNSGATLGASGGVLAILCAVATMRPKDTVLLYFFPIPIAWLAIGWVGLDAVRLLQQIFQGAGSGVDSIAHLSGGVFGFLAVKRGFIWRDYAEDLERAREDRQEQSQQADEARLDALLHQIHSKGMHTLSEREKAFLKRMSKRG